MGVIKPPWISQRWFGQCPFNYCDHFGNKEQLSEICIVCKEELDRLAKYKKEGKDPYDMKNVLNEVGENFAKMLSVMREEAERLGIDLDNLEDDYEKSPPPDNDPIYKLVSKYGNKVETIINNLSEVPIDADMELLEKAVNVFYHSRHYIVAKIARAVSSRWEEKKDPLDETEDAKTSAFLAYIAIVRNSQAAIALAAHKPLVYARSNYLKFAKVSMQIAETIKKRFFPEDKLTYKEFGCEEYDAAFNIS